MLRSILGAFAVMVVAATASHADDLSSGIPVGKRVGTYSTTKCAGVDDGVKEGKSLCYT